MIFFFFKFVSMVDALTEFCMLNHCVSGMKPTCSWWMCSWVQFVSVLLSIFESKIHEGNWSVVFFVESLCGLGLSVTLAS